MPGIDVNENTIRIRQKDPSEFVQESFRTITLSEEKGIKAVVGKLKSDPEGAMVIQTYLFDKDKFTPTEAEAWVASHKRSEESFKTETRSLTSELRFVEEGRMIEGTAIIYNTLSEGLPYRERILSGACKDSLANDIRLLFNHNESKVLGRTKSKTLHIYEDSVGLHFKATVPKWAGDITESISRGDITGCSFKFLQSDYRYAKWTIENGERVASLPKVTLGEISIVPFPVYSQTSVNVRSIQTDSGEAFLVETNNGYFLFSDPVLPESKNDFTERDKALKERLDALSRKIRRN